MRRIISIEEKEYVTVIVSVIVNSRFLQRPPLRSRGNQLIPLFQLITKTKSIGRGSRSRESGSLQTDSQTAMVNGVWSFQTEREVWGRGCIRIGFAQTNSFFQCGVKQLWRDGNP